MQSNRTLLAANACCAPRIGIHLSKVTADEVEDTGPLDLLVQEQGQGAIGK